VYQPSDKATVFIGSSRIKFDLDIPTWEKKTGEKAIQLAVVGSSPILPLQDLANDENFKGKLIIDVTEPLFFSTAPPYSKTPNDCINYYKKRTPSQSFSFQVSRNLESRFAFLNESYLSAEGLLKQAPLPMRQNVFLFPYFPQEFERVTFERQNWMADKFVQDTNLQNMMKNNWTMLFEVAKKFPPPTPQQIEGIFTLAKEAVDKIRSRGGKVLFVRTPASNPMWQGEQMGFPRDAFWNKLLAVTRAEGIHFADYPETSGFICPEWSHLSPADAVVYTNHLINQMEQKGWTFSNRNKQISSN
jgi:hypothetical protein